MRFVSHTDDEDFVYERYDGHYRGIDYPVRVAHVPHFKKLTALVRPELQASLAGLEAGEIDMVGGEGIGPKSAAPYVDDPDFTVQFQAGFAFSIHNVYPNLWQETMEDGSPNPFLDIRVRRAANHAINRQSIIDNLLLGVGEQSLMTYSGVPGYPSPEQKKEVLFEYDVEKAKALMAEAGYADGFDIKLFWTAGWGGELAPDLALLAAQDLAAVGIRAEPVSVPIGDYFTEEYTLNAKNLVAAPGLYWFWANTVPDVGSMWECCTGADGFLHAGPAPGPGHAGAVRPAEGGAGPRAAAGDDHGTDAVACARGVVHLHRRAAGRRHYPIQRQLAQGRPAGAAELQQPLVGAEGPRLTDAVAGVTTGPSGRHARGGRPDRGGKPALGGDTIVGPAPGRDPVRLALTGCAP